MGGDRGYLFFFEGLVEVEVVVVVGDYCREAIFFLLLDV